MIVADINVEIKNAIIDIFEIYNTISWVKVFIIKVVKYNKEKYVIWEKLLLLLKKTYFLLKIKAKKAPITKLNLFEFWNESKFKKYNR